MSQQSMSNPGLFGSTITAQGLCCKGMLTDNNNQREQVQVMFKQQTFLPGMIIYLCMIMYLNKKIQEADVLLVTEPSRLSKCFTFSGWLTVKIYSKNRSEFP